MATKPKAKPKARAKRVAHVPPHDKGWQSLGAPLLDWHCHGDDYYAQAGIQSVSFGADLYLVARRFAILMHAPGDAGPVGVGQRLNVWRGVMSGGTPAVLASTAKPANVSSFTTAFAAAAAEPGDLILVYQGLETLDAEQPEPPPPQPPPPPAPKPLERLRAPVISFGLIVGEPNTVSVGLAAWGTVKIKWAYGSGEAAPITYNGQSTTPRLLIEFMGDAVARGMRITATIPVPDLKNAGTGPFTAADFQASAL